MLVAIVDSKSKFRVWLANAVTPVYGYAGKL